MALNKSPENIPPGGPSQEQTRTQLYRLLQSPDLKVSPRLKNLLAYLVEETLRGRAGNIKAYTIAVEAFGRPEHFNPALDPIVRVEAGKLRRQLELYYLLNQDDPVRISIPLGSYIPVFELRKPGRTGPEKTAPSDAPSPDRAPEGSAPQGNAEAFRKERRPLLAVVPFTCPEDDSALAYFAKGLSESLLVEMAQNHNVDALELFSRSPDRSDLLDTVYRAKERGARFILHGFVQHCQNTLRIFAALTDTSTACRLWTAKFDAEFSQGSFLEVQDAVTSKIVGMVTDGFGLINRTLLRETAHKDLSEIGIYEATLRYHAWVDTFDRNDYLTAKLALEGSRAQEPNNAMICALLSDVYSSDFEFGYDLLPGNLEKGLELAVKALHQDASCQMAHWAMALNYYLRGDIARMSSCVDKVYPADNTNPYLYMSLGLITGMTKSLAEGKEMVEEALRLNPYSPSWCHIVPFMYHYAAQDYEAAFNEAMQMNVPTCIWDPIARLAACGRLGLREESQRIISQLLALEPDFRKKRTRLLSCMVIDQRWAESIDAGLRAAGLA